MMPFRMRDTCPKGPSRLKGIETLAVSRNLLPQIPGPKGPSRLKGMETMGSTATINVVSWLCPKGPSRLKGIETRSLPLSTTASMSSERTFPFEGN